MSDRTRTAADERPDPTLPTLPGDTATGKPTAADRFAALADTASETPPAAPAPPPVPAAPPGFVIEREIGRGGMGVVYLAHQHGLNRPVALKMVPDAAPPKAVIRFLAEAEVIAAVRHPNVVEVYQFGESAGRPYLALEYCGVGDLGSTVAAGPMDPRAAGELMAAVADGVQAAHAAGIVHRDLKPTNVLRAADGTPKVSDFGLAKRGFGSGLTNTDAVMGTPAYMSPEQASGGTKFVGPEADVWALGVMLYELLAGERPFAAADPMDLLVKVMSGEVPPLHTRAADVPRDLDLIVGKCLRREPRERYATAGELAADLRNWLAGRPITARPVGAVEGAVKWARRNKPLAGAVAAAVLALVAGTAVSVWQAARAETRRIDAEDAREREADQRRIAQENEAKAVANLKAASRAVDDCYNVVANNPLLAGDKMKPVRGLLYSVALGYYREFTKVAPDDPALLADYAHDLERVIEITRATGSQKEALTACDELIAARQRLAAAGGPDAQRDLARAHHTRGVLLHAVGRTEESTVALRTAIDEFLTGDTDADRYAAARGLRSLGISLRELSRRDDSIAASELAVGLLDELQRKAPADRDYTLELARAYGDIGYTHALLTSQAERGREKAHDAYLAGRRLADELYASDPTNVRYAASVGTAAINLGILYLRLHDDPAAARRLYAEARDVYRKMSAEYPAEIDLAIGLANSLGNLANTATGDEKRRYTTEASQAFEKALAIDPENARVRTHHSLTLADLAQSHLESGQPERALDYLNRSVAGLRRVYDRDPNDYYNRDYLTHTLTLYGETLLKLNRVADAREPLDEAVKLAEEFLRGQGKGHVKYIGRLADAYGGRAALDRAEKKPAAAVALLRKQRSVCDQLGTSGTRKDHLFAVAEGFAACVPLAATDAEKKEYAAAAVEALRQAVAAGYSNAVAMALSPDLAPVRHRDEFQQILADLKKRSEPKLEELPRPRPEK